jgi:hypothetical protein
MRDLAHGPCQWPAVLPPSDIGQMAASSAVTIEVQPFMHGPSPD